MSKQKQIDNTYLAEKVLIRLDSLRYISKSEINVLEAFAGDGTIWNAVKKQSDKKINILKIEKESGKKGVYLKGDNLKFIPMFEFDNFNIIDLDAYGSPYHQLEVVFLKHYKGIVHCTFIQSFSFTGGGKLHDKMLMKLGYSKTMINKVPSLFCKDGLNKFEQYLALNNVTKIRYIETDTKKHYLYFYLND